jgi:Predicted membrane protein
MMFTANHAMLFIWIMAGIAAVLAILLFRQGMAIKEPYDNPAQLRKLKARNRHWRRVAVGVLLCVVLCAVILTAVKTGDTKQVELSAPEAYTVDQETGVILVPMENVSDGHLHRFEYKTVRTFPSAGSWSRSPIPRPSAWAWTPVRYAATPDTSSAAGRSSASAATW